MKQVFEKAGPQRIVLRLAGFVIVSLMLLVAAIARPGSHACLELKALGAGAKAQVVGLWENHRESFDPSTLLTQFEYVFCPASGAGSRLDCGSETDRKQAATG
jgi:hypothetical protein